MSGIAGVLLIAGTVSAAPARRAAKPVPLSPWEQAERSREALEAIPASTRTQADYEKTLNAYRAIYHQSPADTHAPASIYAVAEILTEEGRGRHNAKVLEAAVGQYEFLRTQYPACSLNTQALLAEAQIEQNDLKDEKAAKDKYKLLVKEHPKSDEAEEAKAALAEMSRPAGTVAKKASHTEAASTAPAEAASTAPVVQPVVTKALVVAQPVVAPVNSEPPVQAEPPRKGPPAQVSGIRHWSTPDYTRVVIDLGDNVTYEAARVPNPDRIFFDLHGTRLAGELVGKNFTVTDDGFLKRIRAAQYNDHVTRVVLDVNDVTEYSAFLLPNPYRLIIDIHGRTQGARPRQEIAALPSEATVTKPSGEIKPAAPLPATPVPNTTVSQAKSGSVEVASLSNEPDKVEATSRPTSKPISAVVVEKPAEDAAEDNDIPAAMPPAVSTGTTTTKRHGTKNAPAESAKGSIPARAAKPTADGETSLVRALGLKINRIVIDAGHGGHDSGTLGVDGIQEKDVVLDVALRLGKMLHERLGAEIIYTRSDDTFIPLETRTAIANKAQADLFLSIHANSSPDATARGVETYYLNFTSDTTALEVAARENAVSDQSVHQLSDLVKKIALKDKIDESREFASDVEQGLYGGLQSGNTGLRNRGVKKAPFVVLIGANMPSILTEISFVTNKRDAEQLREPAYRQRVAESIYRGVAKYTSGLSMAAPPVERSGGQ